MRALDDGRVYLYCAVGESAVALAAALGIGPYLDPLDAFVFAVLAALSVFRRYRESRP